MTYELKIASHSEIGLVRKNNQDSGYASAHLLVVADGMGGAAAGDLASAVAIDTIRSIDEHTPAERMRNVLVGALAAANDRLADLVEADYSLEGMGTTVTGALFDGDEFGIAHIGDSRAYLLRDGELTRLTKDHSWVQSLVDDGKISLEEAAVHPHRSLLLKVLNGQSMNDPDLSTLTAELGDRILICSDGLCGLVDDQTISELLQGPDLEEAMDALVEEARLEGGIDNITVIVADVVADGGTADFVVLGAAAEREIPEIVAPAEQDFEDTVVVAVVPPLPSDQPPHTSPSSPDTESGAALAKPPGPRRALETSDDESRYNPQAPTRRRFLRPLIGLLVLVLVAGAGLSAAYAWSRTQYFVGVAQDNVAIYQGLSGFPAAKVFEVQDLPVTQLPPYYQDRVRNGIDGTSLDAARQTIAELRQAVDRCGPGGTPKPTASESASTPASAVPSGSTSPATTRTPAPSTSGVAQTPSKPQTPATPPVSPSTPTGSNTADPEPTC